MPCGLLDGSFRFTNGAEWCKSISGTTLQMQQLPSGLGCKLWAAGPSLLLSYGAEGEQSATSSPGQVLICHGPGEVGANWGSLSCRRLRPQAICTRDCGAFLGTCTAAAWELHQDLLCSTHGVLWDPAILYSMGDSGTPATPHPQGLGTPLSSIHGVLEDPAALHLWGAQRPRCPCLCGGGLRGLGHGRDGRCRWPAAVSALQQPYQMVS